VQQATLLNAINEAYERRDREANRFPVRGSSLGECPRKLSALLNGHDQRKLEAKTLRVFELGSSRGECLAKVIAEAHPGKASLEQEVLVPLQISSENSRLIYDKALAEFGAGDPDSMLGKLPLSMGATGTLSLRAHCDVVLLSGSERPEVDLIEIKTKNQWGFKKLGEEGIDDGYAMQVMGQVDGLHAGGFEVRSASVLYENKDTCELKLMPFNFRDPDIRGHYGLRMERIRNVLLGWMRGEPMNAAPAVHAQPLVEGKGALPWQCNYCSVGPIAGQCVDTGRLVNKKPNGPIPKWEVTA